MNITITGKPGSGKSTLVRRLLEALDWQPSGFVTLPYQINGERRGFYLHSFTAVPGLLNNAPISVILTPGQSVGIGETFRQLGTVCLRQALEIPADCVVLDEIGRFEQNEPEFLEAVRAVFNQSPVPVIAVLKKEPLPFILELRNRPDCTHVDLDGLDSLEREKCFQALLDLMRLA